METVQVIDCFSGAGGLSLGFREAGLSIKYAFDSDEDSVTTYRSNLGDHVSLKDALLVSRESIKSELGTDLDVDRLVIAGGPPCQGFSIQRRGPDEDVRNHLVFQFIRLVMEFEPRLFVMENVGGLLSRRGKPYVDQIRQKCDRNAYTLHIQELNALDFGVPQNRSRVFLVGEKTGPSQPRYAFPDPTISSQSKPMTVLDAIGDLENAQKLSVANHIWDKLSNINMKRIQYVSQGQGRKVLPLELQIPSQLRNPRHGHSDTYGRMSWGLPAPTITARFDSFSRGRFGHPVKDRSISLREGARLQSFPDCFEFFGTKVSVARQIGNAVPPLLAGSIGRSIVNYFAFES